MFDPQSAITDMPLPYQEAERASTKRHLGHIEVGFGARNKKRGYFLDGEAVNQTPPNRKTRRMRLSFAPRNIRVLARRNRETYKFAHRPWGAWDFFPAEERKRLLEGPQAERRDAVRQVRNMLKRRNDGFARKDA